MSEKGTVNPAKQKEKEELKAKVRQVDAAIAEKQKELDNVNLEITKMRAKARNISKELDALG